MKQKNVLIVALVVIFASAGSFLYLQNTGNEEESEVALDIHGKPVASPFLSDEDKGNVHSADNVRKLKMAEMIKKYKTDESLKISKRSSEVFGNEVLGKALSSWIGYGAIMSSDADYGYEIGLKMALINENPEEAIVVIRDSYNQFKEDDFFIKQMILNVVNQIEIPAEEKLKFYTETAAIPLKLTSDKQLTNDDMNITIAMYMVKENINSEEEALPFAQSLLEKNKDNVVALRLIADRLDGNFPRIKDQLAKEYAKFGM